MADPTVDPAEDPAGLTPPWPGLGGLGTSLY